MRATRRRGGGGGTPSITKVHLRISVHLPAPTHAPRRTALEFLPPSSALRWAVRPSHSPFFCSMLCSAVLCLTQIHNPFQPPPPCPSLCCAVLCHSAAAESHNPTTNS